MAKIPEAASASQAVPGTAAQFMFDKEGMAASDKGIVPIMVLKVVTEIEGYRRVRGRTRMV